MLEKLNACHSLLLNAIISVVFVIYRALKTCHFQNMICCNYAVFISHWLLTGTPIFPFRLIYHLLTFHINSHSIFKCMNIHNVSELPMQFHCIPLIIKTHNFSIFYNIWLNRTRFIQKFCIHLFTEDF